MQSYWLTFIGRAAGCVQAESEYDAKLIGKHVGKAEVATCRILPYPAMPRLSSYIHPVYGETPSFCYSPEKCAGKTSCPSNRSCTE